MSYWKKPMVAAKRAVHAPTMATTPLAVEDIENRKFSRAIIYTPEVTIVAA